MTNEQSKNLSDKVVLNPHLIVDVTTLLSKHARIQSWERGSDPIPRFSRFLNGKTCQTHPGLKLNPS